MSSTKLGRLEVVGLREIWKHEALDFTPWLAKEENLDLLGRTLNLDLELEGQEENVGPFKADILCKDTLNGHYVLIENQLERTDHTHLGQLITYSAGLEAVTIVWIADRFTEEHRAAMDWLNEISDDSAHFFGLEVELWKIGDSAIAPKFNIISKPNEWSKEIIRIAKITGATERSPAKELYYKFWLEFLDYYSKIDKSIGSRTPMAESYCDFAIGRTGFALRAYVSIKLDWVGFLLLFTGPEAKPHFFILEKEKEIIESEIGHSLEWRALLNNKESQIKLIKPNISIEDESNWENIFDWIIEIKNKYEKSFRQRIKTLDAKDYIDSES